MDEGNDMSDNENTPVMDDAAYKALGYKLTAPLSDWFIRNADRKNPNAAINYDPAYFGDECAALINGVRRAANLDIP